MKIADISATIVDHMGSDLSVVNAARVSFHKESKWESDGKGFRKLSEADEKLINYLAKHKHFSPFNHAFISVRMKAPIYVARQLVKHKFMPWNEVSRRYVDEEPEFFFPKEYHGRPVNNKQGSGENVVDTVWFTDIGTGERWSMSCEEAAVNHTNASLDLYTEFLVAGMAPEEARAYLPHNLMTEWIWSGTLGAFADMLKLRLDPHVQRDTRYAAELVEKQVAKYFPVSLKALLENK